MPPAVRRSTGVSSVRESHPGLPSTVAAYLVSAEMEGCSSLAATFCALAPSDFLAPGPMFGAFQSL
jgi:hypothetical protein